MPDAQGKPLAGDPGYQAPAPADPSQSVPGLINQTPGSSTVTPGTSAVGYTPASATSTPAVATGYDPKAFAVTSDQTVQGQLKGLINDDSPLMQQAKTRALQDQNARGTTNSTMAIQAGQQAVIGAALPIAQQDASTYNNANLKTVDAQNTALGFGAAAQNAASQTNAGLGTNVDLSNQAAVNAAFTTTVNNITQLTNTKLNNDTQMALGNLDSATKKNLAMLDANNRQLLQSNANAANMFQETVKNIAAIAVDATLSQDAKDTATQSQINLLNQGLQTTAGIASTAPAAVSGLNLSQYFQPATGTA